MNTEKERSRSDDLRAAALLATKELVSLRQRTEKEALARAALERRHVQLEEQLRGRIADLELQAAAPPSMPVVNKEDLVLQGEHARAEAAAATAVATVADLAYTKSTAVMERDRALAAMTWEEVDQVTSSAAVKKITALEVAPILGGGEKHKAARLAEVEEVMAAQVAVVASRPHLQRTSHCVPHCTPPISTYPTPSSNPTTPHTTTPPNTPPNTTR